MSKLLRRRSLAASALTLMLALIACGPTVLPISPPAVSTPQPVLAGVMAPADLRVRPARDGNAVPVLGGVPQATVAPPTPATPPIPAPSPAGTSVLVPPTPSAVQSAVPLSVMWDRLRALQFAPVLDHLQPVPASARDDRLFGVADALAADDATAPILRGLGASLDRLEVRWDDVEPAPGLFRFDTIDGVLATARQLHFRVLAVIDGTPAWAASAAAVPGAEPPAGLDTPALVDGGRPNPANPWAVFLATVAARYGAQVAAWEIWNEPNSAPFWRGTPAQYARLLAVANTVLSHAAPASPVIIGGMVSDDGRFLHQVAQALCSGPPCPVLRDVGWHVYDNPADITRVATLTRTILTPFAVTPELWITEANVPVRDPDAPADAVTGPDSVTLAQQAAFVIQAYVLARAANVHTLAIYRAADVDDDGHYWGLLRSDMTGRPALLAYGTAARWLSHTHLQSLRHPAPGVTVATFCRPDATVDVAWSDAPFATTVRLPVPAATASLVRATGEVSPLAASNGNVVLSLAAAAPATAATVPLGAPLLLVFPTGCPTQAGV